MKYSVSNAIVLMLIAVMVLTAVGCTPSELQTFLAYETTIYQDPTGTQIVGFGTAPNGTSYMVSAKAAASWYADYAMTYSQIGYASIANKIAYFRSNGWHAVSWSSLPPDVQAFVVGTVTQSVKVLGLLVIPSYSPGSIPGQRCMNDGGHYVDCNSPAPTYAPYNPQRDPWYHTPEAPWHPPMAQPTRAAQCWSSDGLAVVPCR